MPDDAPTPVRSELLPGTLEMLVLGTLSSGPLHGYGIAQRLERSTQGVLRVEPGSLYPALDRVLAKGWVTAAWGKAPTGRRARFYTITRSGRAQFRKKIADYERVVWAITQVLSEA